MIDDAAHAPPVPLPPSLALSAGGMFATTLIARRGRARRIARPRARIS
ncbi:MAG: hypothetical protein V2I65_02180 [Paracoccaceae bacterium]|nr:hypothetical protein [Paracoccaceae bacterium]